MTERDRMMLKFEDKHPKMTGKKPAQIRAELGMTTVAYFAALHTLIDTDEAVREYPVLVHRLQRVRDVAIGRRNNRRFN